MKKYDPELAKDILEWINRVLRHGGHDQLVDDSTGEMNHFSQQLHDGVVLARWVPATTTAGIYLSFLPFG